MRIEVAPVVVGPRAVELDEEIGRLSERMRELHVGKSPREIEELGAARRLYRSLGIDPTRTRPSSEALLRRVLKGQELYRINRLVDAGNWASLCLLLPIGLYDAERVDGPVLLRPGRPGEAYAGVRKEEVHLEGRPVLA